MNMTDTLRQAIEQSGMSHRHIARLADVNRLSVDRFANGTTSISLPQADRIAEVLGLALVSQIKKEEK